MMGTDQLAEVLRKHKLWLLGSPLGEQADLRWANFEEANFEEADLRGANLQRANFQGANFQGADFEEADLRGADLRGANLQRANLRGANLQGANLPFRFSQAFLAPWPVLVTPEYIEIGCQKHPIDRWLDWSHQNAPEEIHAMHPTARAWWNQHKKAVLAMASAIRRNEPQS